MNARNKLKTIVLMGSDTHIVYHANRINKEWGWGLSEKQTVVGVVRVVAIRFNSKGWGGVSLKNRWYLRYLGLTTLTTPTTVCF